MLTSTSVIKKAIVLKTMQQNYLCELMYVIS